MFQKLCSEQLGKQDVPPNIVVVFAEIVANPGRSLIEYGEAVELGQAVMSRSVTILSKGNATKGPGLGLVQKEEDPENQSRKLVTLTKEGKGFLRAIEAEVGHLIKQRVPA